MDTISTASRPAIWKIQLLGGLFVRFGGLPPLQVPHRCQPLLAALCLRPSLRTREQLACLFFPDSADSVAKARLSDRLWLLRNALPGFPFDVTNTEIGILPGQVELDVDIFRSLINQETSAALSAAAGIYSGELLPALDEEWLISERENLHILYIQVLQKLTTHFVRADEPYNAIPILENLVRLEPFDESNLRGLLRAYQAVGQRGAALAAYERFRQMLQTEMDLKPESATQDLVDAIRSQVLPSRQKNDPEFMDSPHDLLRRIRPAVWRGEFDPALDWLVGLRKSPDNIPVHELDALEAEIRILRGDHVGAHQILDRYTGKLPLSIGEQVIRLLGEERQYDLSLEKGKGLLLEAHLQKNILAETLILVEMGNANQRMGNPVEAMRCANQCISLAERAKLPYPLARGYHLKGILLGSQGFDRDALETLHLSAAHAAENGFRSIRAKIEGHLGVFYQNIGKYRTSIEHYNKAIEITRDLNLQRMEAEILQNSCIVYSSLGRNQESILKIRDARFILQGLNDELGLARNSYHLAFSLSYEVSPNFTEILELARQALAVFKRHQALGWIASTHHLLGYVHWLMQEPDLAIDAFQKAIPIYQKLEELDFIPELYGYIGLSMLQKGDLEKALDYTTRAVDEMMRSELYDLASEIYYARAAVLASIGRKDEAEEFLRRGYETLLSFAEEIDDAEARQAYFRRDPSTRLLMDMVYAHGLAAPPQVETHTLLSRQRTPVQVAVTVDAGAPDLALKNASGPVALRRERIARILREARAQGADPSPAQIADVMKVSLRTVQRDIASLEE